MPRFCCPYEEAQFRGMLWTPGLNHSCQCDLDGTDLRRMSLVAGNKLSGWACRITGNNFSQATDSKRPTTWLGTNGINGVKFTASAQTALAFGTPISGSNFTALILTTEQSSTQTQEPLYNGRSTVNGWGFLNNWSGDANKMQAIYGGVAVLQASATRAAGSSYLTILSRMESSNYFEVNGVSYSVSGSNFAAPTNGVSVGADAQTGGSWYDGVIHSVLIFTKTLTDYERKRAAACLLWRHGMQSLIPATNPFKNRPTLIGD